MRTLVQLNLKVVKSAFQATDVSYFIILWNIKTVEKRLTTRYQREKTGTDSKESALHCNYTIQLNQVETGNQGSLILKWAYFVGDFVHCIRLT